MTIGREQLLNDIWHGDKLERRQLAEQVEAYIRGRFEQPAPGTGSFTFAIEGVYGVGKSFFLERLKSQLSLNHAVAYVNAWTDDTANDPLTSIFLAIEQAIAEKLATKDKEQREKVAKQVKDVAKIAAKALVRGVGSVLLTSKGYDELESAFEAGVDDLFDLKSEEQSKTALVSKRKLIADFQSKLSALLDALEADGLFKRPLVVIVDELDRCRPTYAISLLEEAKHFFDDTGTVFVYGMNRKALAATVKAIYGNEFPADHYLMRFVKRQISLPANDLEKLIYDQWTINSHLTEKTRFPSRDGEDNPAGAVPWLAKLFAQSGILARDAEYVLELMFSFMAMWDKKTFIHLPYLACLAVRDYNGLRGYVQDANRWNIPEVVSDFLPGKDGSTLMMRYEQVGTWNYNTLQMEYQRENGAGLYRLAMSEISLEFAENGRFPQTDHSVLVSLVGTYGERLRTVGKFLVAPNSEGSDIDDELEV